MNIAIVGNGPIQDCGAKIDQFDIVVRFNVPRYWNKGAGKKFDIWVIANCGSGSRFAKKRTFLNSDYKNLPSEIFFPRPWGLRPHYKNNAHALLSNNKICSETLFYIPKERYLALLSKLKEISGKAVFPSAGLVAIHTIVSLAEKEDQVVLYGFGFRGWSGHCWKTERKYVELLKSQNKVKIGT